MGLVSSLVVPPLCFYVLAVVGLALVRRRRRLGLGLVGAAAVGLVLASLPVVGALLMAGLEVPPYRGDPRPGVGDAIVILSADLELEAPEYGEPTLGAMTLERLRYGAKLARETRLPLLTTGGALHPSSRPVAILMAEALEGEYGLKVRWREAKAGTTHENARLSCELLEADGIERVFLVTHAWHMPRARRAFERQGLVVVPAPTGYRVRPRPTWRDFVPSSKALWTTSLALHEWIGGLWYALRYD